jgi:type II secretory pathway component GspD/PulD (secretin)
LLVQGTADQLRVAEDTVRIFDVDQLSGMSVAVVPLKNGVPAALVGELQNIFGATHKEADSNVIRFLAIDRLNAVMVLTRQPRYLDEARAWIERLDRARNDVSPHISSGGSITMDIKLTDSDVMPTTSSTIDSPTISQRRLKSTISVKSGNSILLGGLIQEADNRDASGIPILHTLPVIGPLFGTRRDNVARTELIMLLTPHVISNDLDAQDITQTIERQFGDALNRTTMVPPR